MYKYLLGLAFIGILVTGTYATDVVVQQKQVIFDARQFLGLDGYYRVGEDIKQEKEVQAAEDKLDRISAQLEVLIKLMSGGKVEPAPTPAVTPEPTKPTETPVIPLDDVTTSAHKILKNKCYNCHKAQGTNSFKIFDADGKVNLDLAGIVKVHHRTEALVLEPGESAMPKGSLPLNNDEMLTIKKWLKLEAYK